MAGLSLPGSSRSASGRAAIPTAWRGRIVELYTDQTVAAVIPSLYGDQAMRVPCVVAGLTKGDRVILLAIEGRADDLIVIAPG